MPTIEEIDLSGAHVRVVLGFSQAELGLYNRGDSREARIRVYLAAVIAERDGRLDHPIPTPNGRRLTLGHAAQIGDDEVVLGFGPIEVSTHPNLSGTGQTWLAGPREGSPRLQIDLGEAERLEGGELLLTWTGSRREIGEPAPTRYTPTRALGPDRNESFDDGRDPEEYRAFAFVWSDLSTAGQYSDEVVRDDA